MLAEFLFKLSYFYIIGFFFGLLEFFFLNFTENTPPQKGTFNIIYYFPLSYGVLLPIFSYFFCLGAYFPIGMVKFQNFNPNFEIDHLESRAFAFFSLLLVLLFSASIISGFGIDLEASYMTYLIWFFQVLLVYILFSVLPFYPALLGIFILKELKKYFIRKHKIENLWQLTAFTKVGGIFFIFFAMSLNYKLFYHKVMFIISFILTQDSFYFNIASMFLIILFLSYLMYVKKRRYQQYITYIKSILKESFFRENSPQDKSH